jgi:hypothetical protein
MESELGAYGGTVRSSADKKLIIFSAIYTEIFGVLKTEEGALLG